MTTAFTVTTNALYHCYMHHNNTYADLLQLISVTMVYSEAIGVEGGKVRNSLTRDKSLVVEVSFLKHYCFDSSAMATSGGVYCSLSLLETLREPFSTSPIIDASVPQTTPFAGHLPLTCQIPYQYTEDL